MLGNRWKSRVDLVKGMIAYKYRSGRGIKDNEGKDVFERDIELLSRDTIYVPTVDQLNDPSEALVDDNVFKAQLSFFELLASKEAVRRVEESYYNIRARIRSAGIYSLGKEIQNELMWAYYANGHNGYAIIIDTEILLRSFKQGKWVYLYDFDVNYSKRLPRFKLPPEDDKNIFTCLVGTKSKAWEHEAEHRLLFDKGGVELKIDYRAIKGIVFGCRMPDEDIDYVMKTFSGRDFEYHKIAKSDYSYKLTVERLIDRYPTTEKYSPNNVTYNIEELLEADKCIGCVGYKYRKQVEAALKEVSREPFVTGISHIVVTDDKGYPHILIWTNIKQDGVVAPMRYFEFDVIGGEIVRVGGA